jgi:hypothetical protein
VAHRDTPLRLSRCEKCGLDSDTTDWLDFTDRSVYFQQYMLCIYFVFRELSGPYFNKLPRRLSPSGQFFIPSVGTTGFTPKKISPPSF